MQVHAGNAGAVRREHALDGRGIVDVGGALVVDDDIVALGVIRVAIDWEQRFGGRSALGNLGVNLIHDNISPGFDALLEDVFLFHVIVAATARDQQNAQRLHVRGVDEVRG